MMRRKSRGWSGEPAKRGSRGFTMIELIAAITILSLLVGLALPLAKISIKRERERVLRRELWEMRDAIDHYKEAADHGLFQIKLGSEGYPPDLGTLVNGVDVGLKKVRFLRRIAEDPMTGKAEWALRSLQDDPNADSWGGDNVFDVHSKSDGIALDGTKYKDW
jgi:general secretion pathway protein G